MRKQFNTLLIEGSHFHREATGLVTSLLKKTLPTEEHPQDTERIDVSHLKLPHPSRVLEQTIHEGLQILANKPHFRYKDTLRREAQRVNQVTQKLKIQTEQSIVKKYRATPSRVELKSVELGEKEYRSFHKVMNTLSTAYESSTQMTEEDLFREEAQKGSLEELKLPRLDDEVLYKLTVLHPITGQKTQEFLCNGEASIDFICQNINCVEESVLAAQGLFTDNYYFLFVEGVFYTNECSEKNPLHHILHLQQNEKKNFSIEENNYAHTAYPEFLQSLKRDSTLYSSIDEGNGRSYLSSNKIYGLKSSEEKIKDIQVRVSETYIFRHAGKCDHYVLITDIRLAHDHRDRKEVGLAVEGEENKRGEQFIVPVFDRKLKVRSCQICDGNKAKLIVMGKELFGDECYHFVCEKCHHDLVYEQVGLIDLSEKGETVVKDVYVFPYFHD